MKEIILDTETTGLSVREGHRIVEIGCIELENLIPTKKQFHYYLNPEKTWGIGLMVLGIGWIASIFTMKLSLMPFEKLFESIESLDILDTPEAFIGKICTIKSPRADQKFGQAEIENPNGAPFLFNVKPTRESEVLKRGESAVIVDTSDKVFNIKKINI